MASRQLSAKKPKDLGHTLRTLLSYLGRHKFLLLAVGVLVAVSATANLLGTYMIRPIVNGVLENGSAAYLAGVVALTAGIYIVGALSTLGYTQLMVRAAQKILQDIRRDLFAQAAFDSLTVHKLLERRHIYQPGCISLPEEAMNETMTQLYRRGLTVVSTRRGYGLYFTKGDTLQFLELQADNDHCADQLLQAAREKTGAANARILLAENQTLYLGSGRRCGYGMIAFLGRPFSVTDAYFRMLL